MTDEKKMGIEAPATRDAVAIAPVAVAAIPAPVVAVNVPAGPVAVAEVKPAATVESVSTSEKK